MLDRQVERLEDRIFGELDGDRRFGGDFGGVDELPVGLENVSTYPALFAELVRRGYSKADLAKIAKGNALRVMRGAEKAARK